MKILLVTTGLGMGGAENVVSNLADELVKLGYKVKIVYLTGEVLISPNSAEVELISIGMNGAKDFFKAYYKLRYILNKFKPDIVHSHMFHSNILSRLLRLSTKVPKLICTAHSNNEGGKLRMLAYRLTDNLADISTNVSEEAVKEFIHKGAVKSEKIVAIPNGVDTDKFFFDPNFREEKRSQLSIVNEKMILCVGRLDEPKDYPNLFSAIALLKEYRQDFKVFVVGDGPLKHQLNQLVKKLSIEKYVIFLGVRNDIKELMSAADVYVMSSAWEGLPMVILEAMACERFVIATDCGGIRKAIGSCGVVVETKNVDELSKELDIALNMTIVQRSAIGFNARQRVKEKYSLSKNTDSYLKLYDS